MMANLPTAQPRSTPPGVRALLAAFALLLCSPAWSAELATILAATAVEPPARIGFREERHNPLFREPLVLEGRLEYLDSGTLRKVVDKPFAEDILVADNRITVTRDGKTRRVSLNRSRALKTILGAIEAVLAGNQERLEASFRCEIATSADGWSLQMTPLSTTVAKRLSLLEVSGNAQAVTSIRINLPNDEWHLMQIGDELPR
jgi:hypothetical protein